MRFTQQSACSPEILADLAKWKADAVPVKSMCHALLVGRGLSVSDQTVRNWLAGKVPKQLAERLQPGDAVPWQRPS